MAGAIREHVEAGREVILVLLTRGENGGLLDIMNGTADCPLGQDCPGGGAHRFGLGQDDIVRGRTAEFRAAARRLGVDRVVVRDRPDSAWGDYPGFVQEVRATIQEFEARCPGASHKLVNGYRDVVHGGNPDEPNLTHKACREAAEGLAGLDFRFTGSTATRIRRSSGRPTTYFRCPPTSSRARGRRWPSTATGIRSAAGTRSGTTASAS